MEVPENIGLPQIIYSKRCPFETIHLSHCFVYIHDNSHEHGEIVSFTRDSLPPSKRSTRQFCGKTLRKHPSQPSLGRSKPMIWKTSIYKSLHGLKHYQIHHFQKIIPKKTIQIRFSHGFSQQNLSPMPSPGPKFFVPGRPGRVWRSAPCRRRAPPRWACERWPRPRAPRPRATPLGSLDGS